MFACMSSTLNTHGFKFGLACPQSWNAWLYSQALKLGDIIQQTHAIGKQATILTFSPPLSWTGPSKHDRLQVKRKWFSMSCNANPAHPLGCMMCRRSHPMQC
eukprot:1157356-Pelagomonas_calceolata.AAC.12